MKFQISTNTSPGCLHLFCYSTFCQGEQGNNTIKSCGSDSCYVYFYIFLFTFKSRIVKTKLNCAGLQICCACCAFYLFNTARAALHCSDGDSDAFAHIKDTMSGNLKLLGTDLSSFTLYECLCLSLCPCIITYTLHREH